MRSSRGSVLSNTNVRDIIIDAASFQFFTPSSSNIYVVFTSPDVVQHDTLTNRAFWYVSAPGEWHVHLLQDVHCAMPCPV